MEEPPKNLEEPLLLNQTKEEEESFLD